MFEKTKIRIKAYAPAIAVVIAVIGVIVGVLVGLIVTGNLGTIANSYDLGTTGNSTRTAIVGASYNAFNLLTIIPVVLGAGVLMYIIGGWMTGSGKPV